MYACESWPIKKAEGWRTDAFELWCWRRLLRVPWTTRRSNQSILKEISPEYSLEGLMLKLKLQYFLATWYEELTHLKRPWCWERLKVGGEGDNRGWDGWMASPTQWTWVWVNSGSWWWTGRPGMLHSMESQRVRHDWVTELNNWTNSLEGLMLKLKLQYFCHLIWRSHSLEKILMLGKIEARRNKGMTEDEMAGWHHQLNGHEFEHESIFYLSFIINHHLCKESTWCISLSIIYL